MANTEARDVIDSLTGESEIIKLRDKKIESVAFHEASDHSQADRLKMGAQLALDEISPEANEIERLRDIGRS